MKIQNSRKTCQANLFGDQTSNTLRSCAPNLKSLSGKMDGVWISIPPQRVNAVLEEAAEIGFKIIWLHQGARSKEVQETVGRLDLPVVSKSAS
jgi:predicted CoA-binding protein